MNDFEPQQPDETVYNKSISASTNIFGGLDLNCLNLISQGAEAKVYLYDNFLDSEKKVVIKHRFPKTYRHKVLDEKLNFKRTLQESRSLVKCLSLGIACPNLYYCDGNLGLIFMEYMEGSSLKTYLQTQLFQLDLQPHMQKILKTCGEVICQLHFLANLTHGDLTTSNFFITEHEKVVLIDFGLATNTSTNFNLSCEDWAVDLYVWEKALKTTHPHHAPSLLSSFLQGYTQGPLQKKAEKVLNKLEEVRLRGRKRSMVG